MARLMLQQVLHCCMYCCACASMCVVYRPGVSLSYHADMIACRQCVGVAHKSAYESCMAEVGMLTSELKQVRRALEAKGLVDVGRLTASPPSMIARSHRSLSPLASCAKEA